MFEEIKKIIAQELNIKDESKITMDAKLIDDLGADSLDAVELIMAVEEQYNIKISDEVAQSIQTVGDIVRYAE
ncbi:MAG: acyl carrier protein, partial [Bacilli bacterium]|nr:acyl carrier protein [Bacilli bacterium]